jgi:hypothetical protein
MDFICKRCNIKFSSKPRLKTHLQRKNICTFIETDCDRNLLIEELYERKLNDKTYTCEYCNKQFNHASTKSQHKKICKSKPLDEITQLKTTVNQLVSKIEILETQPKNNNTTNNNNNTQININGVKLRDFGRENMDALPESLISSLFLELRFRELLAQLHCDPNYPENQNVRLKSIKRNTMEIFRNNKWDLVNFNNGLTELLIQGHRIFKDYYKNNKQRILKEDMDEDELRNTLGILDDIESLNKNEIKPLIEDLEMMLEEFKNNGSAIIVPT